VELVLPPHHAVTRSVRSLLASGLLLCLGGQPAGLAQRGPGAAPSRGPGWLPRESSLNSQYVKFTAAEMATTVNRLKEIERILLQIPELANPEGFEIEPAFFGGNDPGSTGNVIGSRYVLRFYWGTRKISGEGTDCIGVYLNYLYGADPTPYRNERGVIYLEQEPGQPVPGATRVWRTLSPTERSWTSVSFTSGGKSPWRSVTREAFLSAVIEQAEGKDGAVLATLRRARSETGYRRWLAEAPQRKAGWDGLAAGLPPAEAAKARKQFEDVERETTAVLKAGEAAEVEEVDRNLARITQQNDRWRARIAAMSPAERNAPDSPVSIQVLQEDPQFFKARRSRIEVRNIVVRLSASLTCNTPVVQRAVWQAYQKLDWAALARLLEPASN
jgi:hypothetical protein